MKSSAAIHLLPFEVEDILASLGQRVSAARRARGLTQPDLAAKAGIGMSTMVAIEKGAPTVQFGFWLSVLWALDLLEGFAQLAQLGRDPASAALMEEHLPKRVRNRRKPKAAP